eukprot:1779129-Pyramimonas_sp.AAC.1
MQCACLSSVLTGPPRLAGARGAALSAAGANASALAASFLLGQEGWPGGKGRERREVRGGGVGMEATRTVTKGGMGDGQRRNGTRSGRRRARRRRRTPSSASLAC